MFNRFLNKIKNTFINLSKKLNQRERESIYLIIKRGKQVNWPTEVIIDSLHKSETFGKKGKENKKAKIFREWRQSLHSGDSLYEAMENNLPANEVMLLQAGEISGKTLEAIEAITFIQNRISKIKKVIFTAMALPSIITLATLALYLWFGIYALPQFFEIVPQEEWVGPSATFANLLIFLKSYIIYIAIVLIILVIIVVSSFPKWTGKYRRIADFAFPFSIYKIFQETTFLLSFAGLLNSNIDEKTALQKLNRKASPWLKEKIDDFIFLLKSGKSLGEVFYEAGHNFPNKKIIIDLIILSSTSNVGTDLGDMARSFIDYYISTMKRTANIVQGLFIAFAISAIVYYTLSFYLMNDFITSSLTR